MSELEHDAATRARPYGHDDRSSPFAGRRAQLQRRGALADAYPDRHGRRHAFAQSDEPEAGAGASKRLAEGLRPQAEPAAPRAGRAAVADPQGQDEPKAADRTAPRDARVRP